MVVEQTRLRTIIIMMMVMMMVGNDDDDEDEDEGEDDDRDRSWARFVTVRPWARKRAQAEKSAPGTKSQREAACQSGHRRVRVSAAAR